MRTVLTLAAVGVAVLTLPIAVGIVRAPVARAQSQERPDWQAAAGGHMAFEVASVKLMKPGSFGQDLSFRLDPGPGFTHPRTGESPHGRFSAGFEVTSYIVFAYKLMLSPDQRQAMIAHLPKWVDTDRFYIDAKAAGNPTKDQMRRMMQSLLAERFHLAVHYETQEMPVYALTLIKPGKWGPKLIRHADGPPCEPAGADDPDAEVFPPICDVQGGRRKRNGRQEIGSRNSTMALLAWYLSMPYGPAGRPVVDRSGITDTIDYHIEFTPESNRAGIPGGDVPPDPQDLTLMEAVRDQLGLKLESTKAPLRILVIDHIERPSEN